MKGYSYWKDAERRQRAQYLRRKYLGFTIDDYEERLRQQKNKCAACGKRPRKKYGLIVDQHQLLLLCRRCGSLRNRKND